MEPDPCVITVTWITSSMYCFLGISILGNFDLLDHVIDFSPEWSDSLSLHFYHDGLVLLHFHEVFDLFA